VYCVILIILLNLNFVSVETQFLSCITFVFFTILSLFLIEIKMLCCDKKNIITNYKLRILGGGGFSHKIVRFKLTVGVLVTV